eukprot:scaffold13678_cov64-Phaeocystis_antarctica.AAC.1
MLDTSFTYLYTVAYSRPHFLAIMGRRGLPFIGGAAFRGEPRGATLQLQGRTECSEDLWRERAASGRWVKEVGSHALSKCAGMDVQVGSCLVRRAPPAQSWVRRARAADPRGACCRAARPRSQ